MRTAHRRTATLRRARMLWRHCVRLKPTAADCVCHVVGRILLIALASGQTWRFAHNCLERRPRTPSTSTSAAGCGCAALCLQCARKSWVTHSASPYRVGASRLEQISHILQVPVAFFFEGALIGSDLSMAQIDDFVSDSDCLRLMRAFMRIDNTTLRRRIAMLVQEIAGVDQ